MNILVPKNVYLDDGCQKNNKNNIYIYSLKKYSRAAGERSQVKKVEDMVVKIGKSLSSRGFFPLRVQCYDSDPFGPDRV